MQSIQTVKSQIEEILERQYLDTINKILYKDYWVDIYEINGKNVSNSRPTRISTNAINNDDSQLTLYDLDPDNILGTPVILTARIECADNIADSLIRKSGLDDFVTKVEHDLKDYFNNSRLSFSVLNTSLHAALKFPETTEEPKDAEDAADTTALIVSAIIMSGAALTSMAAFVVNKKKGTKVDNAAFYTPMLVALGIYDFISDINLCIQIFNNDKLEIKVTNIIFMLAILSVVFVILPFISNLWYAMRINRQKQIRECPSARAWFGKHLAQFILLCVVCAGTYPVLGLTSSRLFGLEFFNAGLMSDDLHKLSKIKIRSTIFMENVPQLLIQILYTIAIGHAENATILAFIASSLSVIASIVIYKAQKEQNEESVISKYYIRFTDHKTSNITDKQRSSIKQRKGYKMALGEKLCTVFEIPKKSIEIGFVTENVKGCIIHIQHSIFKDNLDELRDELYSQQLGEMGQGFVFNITPELFAQNIYQIYAEQVNDIFRAHFRIDDRNFMATYHKSYKDATTDQAQRNSLIGNGNNTYITNGAVVTANKANNGLQVKRNDLGIVHKMANIMRSNTKRRIGYSQTEWDEQEDDGKEEKTDAALEMTIMDRRRDKKPEGITNGNGEMNMSVFFNLLQSQNEKIENMELLLQKLTKFDKSEEELGQATINELDNMLNVEVNIEKQFSTPM